MEKFNPSLTFPRHYKTNFRKTAWKIKIGRTDMKLKIKDFLALCGIRDSYFYPGKRQVWKLPQPGENKSHSFVGDWRQPDLVRFEIKAGLSGKDMLPKELKKYPISFQSPTYIEVGITKAAAHDEDEGEGDEESGEGSRSGKSGGGGRAMKKKHSLNAFSEVVRGQIPEFGEVQKLVLMGKVIAKGAYEAVLGALAAQVKNMSVAPVNLLASVTNVTRVAPGGRSANDIDPTLLKGTKPYKPQPDMFGPPPT
jgi:hypothetical protein